MKMRFEDAIITLDEMIPEPNNTICEEHQMIENAWDTIRKHLFRFQWIDARDEIPPDQEEVLVCTKSKNGIRNIDKGYWAIDRFIHRGCAEVTHWMPLPEKPHDH